MGIAVKKKRFMSQQAMMKQGKNNALEASM